MSEIVKPAGVEFYSNTLKKQMVLCDSGSWKGWLLYQHPDGQWVSLRKATEQDMEDIAVAQGALIVKTPPVEANTITVRHEWKFKVDDMDKLAAAKPELCVILANTPLIMAEIKGGMRTCPGLTIYEEVGT